MVRFRLLAGITTLSLCRIGSAIMEGTEDDFRLVVALLQRSRIEGNQSHRGTYRDVVACRIVVRTALRERHVEVEVVRSEHIALARFRVYAVDTRFSDYPDSSLVVFYHALYDAFVNIDGMEVFHLQVVLQERFAHNLFHQTALLRDIHLAAGVLHDIVHIVCSQTSCIVRYVVGLVVILDIGDRGVLQVFLRPSVVPTRMVPVVVQQMRRMRS